MRGWVILAGVVLICITAPVSTVAASGDAGVEAIEVGDVVVDDQQSPDHPRDDTTRTNNTTRRIPDIIGPDRGVRPSVEASANREYDANVMYDLLPNKAGWIRMSVNYSVPPGKDGPIHAISGSTVIHTVEGFNIENQSFGSTLRYDGTTPDPRLVIEFNGNDTRYGPSYYEFVVTKDWALIRDRMVFLGGDVTYDAEKPVTVSPDGWVFIGEHDVRQFSPLNNQTISLVLPEAASLTASGPEIEATLANAARSLSVGGVKPNITAFAAPEPIRRGGLANDASFWVSADSRVNYAGNTWIHEYVHTRQDFLTTDKTSWTREGMATYYAAYLTYLQGRISFSSYSDVIGGMSPGNRETVLMSQNLSYSIGYSKGSTALARLNEWLSDSGSSGQRSVSTNRLQDVITRWNTMSRLNSRRFYHSLNATGAVPVTQKVRDFLETSEPVGPPRLNGMPPIYPRVQNVSVNVTATNGTTGSVVATRSGSAYMSELNYDAVPHVSRSQLTGDGSVELPIGVANQDQTLLYINDNSSRLLPDFFPIATVFNGSVVHKNTTIPRGYEVKMSIVADDGTPIATDSRISVDLHNENTSYVMDSIQLNNDGSTSIEAYSRDKWPSHRPLRLGGEINLSASHRGRYMSMGEEIQVQVTGPTFVQFVHNSQDRSEMSQTIVHDREPVVGETIQFTSYTRQRGVTSINVDGNTAVSKQRDRIREGGVLGPDYYRANINLTFNSSGPHTIQVNDDPPFTVQVDQIPEVIVSPTVPTLTQGKSGNITASLVTDNSHSTSAYVKLRRNGTAVTVRNVTVPGRGSEEVRFDVDTAGVPPGNYTYEVAVRNETTPVTLTVEPALAPLPGESDPPIDVDGDGLLEDVDGDGAVTTDDVLTYYDNRKRDVVRNNTRRFDFDGDGVAGTVSDALALHEAATSQ